MAVTVTPTATWGITGTVDSVTGVVIEISKDEAPQLGTEINEQGAVIGQVHYDTKKTMRATIQVASTVEPPEAGAAITIDGVAGYVVSASVVESATNYRRIIVQAEAWAHCSSVTTP